MPFTMNAVGRLAHEPVLSVGQGQPWVEFRLLDSRRIRDGGEVVEAATFVAFGEMAEEFCARIEKGQLVHAWGSQMTERFPGRDGVERVKQRFKLFHFEPGARPHRSRAQKAESAGSRVSAPKPAASGTPRQPIRGEAVRPAARAADRQLPPQQQVQSHDDGIF